MRKLKQQLQVLLIAGASAFTFTPAFAEDLNVTVNNYVRAETDFQMKGYIENYDSFGKLSHFREPYDVDNQVTVPAEAASYVNVVPEKNDGTTAYTLTVKDVPVDAFWSVTLYDEQGWMPVNEYNSYSFNTVTAEKDANGSITVHFGGDPAQANFLPIVPGWNYIARLYKPRQEILDGTWTFPEPKPVE